MKKLTSLIAFFLLMSASKSWAQKKVDHLVNKGSSTRCFMFPIQVIDAVTMFRDTSDIVLPCLPYTNWVYDEDGKTKLTKLFVLENIGLPDHLKRSSRWMTYYTGKEPELYQKIRADSGVIYNAYIEHLWLDSLTDTIGKNKIIPYNLLFRDCIIVQLTEPKGFGPTGGDTQGKFDSLIFKGVLSMENCVIDYFTFYKSIFQNEVSIIDCHPIASSLFSGNINFKNCRFNDKCFLSVYNLRLDADNYHEYSEFTVDSVLEKKWLPRLNQLVYGPSEDDSIYNKYVFDNCIFRDTLNVYNPDRYSSVYITDCTLYNQILLGGTYAVRSYWINSPTITDPPYYSIYNLSLNKSKFLKGINFENSICINFDCTSAFFGDTLFVFNSPFKKRKIASSGGLFSKSYFDENSVLVLGKDNIYTLDSLQINPVSFERLTVVNDSLIGSKMLSKQELENQQLFYNTLSKWATDRYSNDVASKIKAKLDHQSLMITNNYNGQHFWSSSSSAFSYMRIRALEILIGNGYKGEGNFVLSVLGFLCFFTLLYFVFFRNDVVNYMLEQYEKVPNDGKIRPSLINFARCFWISFILFISPKYPVAIFKQKKTIFIFFTLEWMIGLGMIVLFLVYIAINYSFIKTLLGL
jgi:hypothetical protein